MRQVTLLFFDSLFRKKSNDQAKTPRSQHSKVPLINYSQRLDIFDEQPTMENLLNWVYSDFFDKYCVVHCADDGMFTVLKYRGPDMDSSTPEELVHYIANINNVIKKFDTGYVLYFDVQRVKSTKYDKSDMPTALTARIEEEREAYYSGNQHFESDFYFIVYHIPPVVTREKLTGYFVQESTARAEGKMAEAEKNLKLYKKIATDFTDNVHLLEDMLSKVFKELRPLNEQETLSYLHDIVSDHHVTIQPNPSRPIKQYITDAALLGGRKPKLGHRHMRIVTIKDFPTAMTPGIFNAFNYLNFEYRWVSRFNCLSKLDGMDAIKKYKQEWHQQIIPLFSQVKMAVTNSPASETAVDDNAAANYRDASTALTEVGEGIVSVGYFTLTMIVYGDTKDQADSLCRKVIETISSMGFAAAAETDNAIDAWRGSLPGNYRCNLRNSLIESINFCHLAPTTAAWSGDKRNECLKGPVLLYTDSTGNTPFRLSLHVGQVGHTMVVGPSGSGKSVLLNTIEAHFLKYPNSNVFIFDKAASSRALTLAVGGSFYNLVAQGNGELSFQPLAHIKELTERQWASAWIISYLESQNMKVDGRTKDKIWNALESMCQMPESELTMSLFSDMVQDVDIRIGIKPLTKEGAYGGLFDNAKDYSGKGRWQVFEMEKLMATPEIVPSTLDYLFHRIETQLSKATGPSIIVLDECWLFFDNPAFRDKLREYFKDMRKKNTSIIFATQNLADVVANKGPLFTTVSENCPSRIYLPNPNAANALNAEMYRAFGLNDSQINIIAHIKPQHDYYYACAEKGNRVFALALQPSELPFVTSTSKSDQQAMNKLIAAGFGDDFVHQWLHYKGFGFEWPKIAKLLSQGLPMHL